MRKASTTNSAQRAYMLAKAHLQALKDREAEIERAYIIAHSIRNADDTIPERVYCIDNMETSTRAPACGRTSWRRRNPSRPQRTP